VHRLPPTQNEWALYGYPKPQVNPRSSSYTLLHTYILKIVYPRETPPHTRTAPAQPPAAHRRRHSRPNHRRHGEHSLTPRARCPLVDSSFAYWAPRGLVHRLPPTQNEWALYDAMEKSMRKQLVLRGRRIDAKRRGDAAAVGGICILIHLFM